MHNSGTADAQDLERLGYGQELLRSFGGFSNFAVSFTVISILTGAVTLFDYGLSMGGPRQMLIGWPLVSLGTLAVALSMAELCSAIPTSGGMYHWSAELGGPMWAWFTAWLNNIGLLAAIAGIDYGCAQFLLPMLGFQSNSRTLLIVYAGLLASQAAINHYSTALIGLLSNISVIVHVTGVVVLIGALLVFAPKQPLGFLWATNNLPVIHAPYVWLFLLGLLQAQWTYSGYDASAHVAEETLDPRRYAPWGLVMSVVVSGIFGYVMILALTLAIPNVNQVLQATDKSGNPVPAVLTIVRLSLGTGAANGVLLLTVMAMWFCGLAAVTSVSRGLFALARDNGMPLAGFWSQVNPKLKTPGPAIWLSAGLAFAAVIYSGAYSVVTSISVVGFYLSYVIPIYLGWKKKSTWIAKRGPWHLGVASDLINALAVLWTVFICIVMIMPPNARAGWGLLLVMGPLFLLHLGSGKHKMHKPRWDYENAISDELKQS